MNVVLTGAAGFIGFHTSLALLKKKNFVYGIDDFNPYYYFYFKRDRSVYYTNLTLPTTPYV